MARWTKPLVHWTAILALTLNSACMFRELRRNIDVIDRLSVVSGVVNATPAGNAITVVVLVRSDTGAVIDSFVLGRGGRYFFTVQQPGAYSVGAFIDADSDLHYDPATEKGIWYGAPARLNLVSGERLRNIDLDLDSTGATRIATPLVAPSLGQRGVRELPDVNLGTLTSIDDPRFTDDNASLGMWQPVDFALRNYSGIYFTEPFDPHKIPVLFVHGINGHPGNFKYLVEHLDHSKFQPWLLYYPTGVRLDTAGAGLLRWISATAVQNRFDRIIVVAHSMGGLVARSAINQWSQTVGKKAGVKLLAFVSISTPWGGHEAAAKGVEHAPEVVPAWIDMAPNSEFLQGLFTTPLPENTPFTLLFGFEGGRLIAGGVNDGVVNVASELYGPAQQQAQKVYGYPESHMGILSSQAVSDQLNALLAEASQ